MLVQAVAGLSTVSVATAVADVTADATATATTDTSQLRSCHVLDMLTDTTGDRIVLVTSASVHLCAAWHDVSEQVWFMGAVGGRADGVCN